MKAIFENYPELKVENRELEVGLASAVNFARNSTFLSPPEDFTNSELSTARSSAEAVHPKFRLPIFLALLSRKKRPSKSYSLKGEIEKLIASNKEDTVNNWFLKEDIILQDCKEAEIIQFLDLFQEAYGIYQQEPLEDLAEQTSALSLTPHYEESIEPYNSVDESEDEVDTATAFDYSDDEDSAERNNMNDNIVRMIEGDWGF